MAVNTNNLYDLTDPITAGVYLEEIRNASLGRSGVFGKMKVKAHRKYLFSLDGKKEDRKPKDMLIYRADGVEIFIPSDWFLRSGKVKKSRIEEYKKLVLAEDK